ncbi:MAG TPA: CDP-alcohol phosphatidyltransferase family protein, partial [Kofleriaceae bacterium]|nr:CDP-alcohol phosphatidyltransferase family protein [Kofleriaceae bacterium]
MTKLDAIVLADDGLSRTQIAGLTVRERAVRVAKKLGAERVFVTDGDRSALSAWRARTSGPVLVLRADQLVHTDLAAPLVAARPTNGIASAVAPDGSYAGALVATGAAADAMVERLARGDSDISIAADAEAQIPHGPVACHPIRTREQRRAATRLLYSILIKPQDNALTRYLYRPVSLPMTKVLVWTPITPNQVSILVGLLVLVGCYLSMQASMLSVLAGTSIILFGQYLDCCDGEIARVKLMSSRFGAWLDTIVDELSTVGYMVALGWHCHLYFGRDYFGDVGRDPWIAMVWIGAVTYGWACYCIYYNIIVAVGSANSQDYVGKFDVVPGAAPNTVRLRPAAPTTIPTKNLPPWLATIATLAPYVVRRDFIAILSVVLAALHLTQILFI